MDKVLKGQYVVGEKLGESPFSITYRAQHVTTQKLVIVKMYRRGSLVEGNYQSVLAKMRAFQCLTHPVYPALLDGDTSWQGFYFIREFVEGESIQEKVAKGDRLSGAEIEQWTAELAAGLQAAHAQGIIHGALSLRNVYFTREKKLKLVDFVLDPVLRSQDAYRVRSMQEDPHFLSPEELLGREVTPATDVYKLAIFLYRLWTGRYPFQDGPPLSICLEVLRKDPPHPRDFNGIISIGADHMILRALSKDPSARFDRIQDFVDSVRSGVPSRSHSTIQLSPDTEPVFRELIRLDTPREELGQKDAKSITPSVPVPWNWRKVVWGILSVALAGGAGYLFFRFMIG